MIQAYSCYMTSDPGREDGFCISPSFSYLHLSSNPSAWTRVCVLVRTVKHERVTQQLFIQNRTEHASHCHRSFRDLLPWGSCVLLSARGHVVCWHAAMALSCSYGSVMQGPALQNYISPRLATLIGSTTRGRSRDWKAGAGSGLSARYTQHLPRFLPGSSSSFPRQPLNPRYSFSIFRFAELAALPTPQPVTSCLASPQSLGLSPRCIL